MQLIKSYTNPGETTDDYDWHRAWVKVTPEEEELLRDDDYETEQQLYEVAGTFDPYYGGPGRRFIHSPGYSIRPRNVVRVTQTGGWDV